VWGCRLLRGRWTPCSPVDVVGSTARTSCVRQAGPGAGPTRHTNFAPPARPAAVQPLPPWPQAVPPTQQRAAAQAWAQAQAPGWAETPSSRHEHAVLRRLRVCVWSGGTDTQTEGVSLVCCQCVSSSLQGAHGLTLSTQKGSRPSTAASTHPCSCVDSSARGGPPRAANAAGALLCCARGAEP
jgi:hypothetical protein